MPREIKILLLVFVLVVGPAVLLTGLAGRVIAQWRVILEAQMERTALRAVDQAARSAGADLIAACDGLRQSVERAWNGEGRWAAMVAAAAGFKASGDWCRGVYVGDLDGRVLYPPLASSERLTDTWVAEESHPLYRRAPLAEALSLQFALTNDAAAVRAYAAFLAQPGLTPGVAAQVRLLSAAGNRRLGRLREAELDLRQVVASANGEEPLRDPDERYPLDMIAQQRLVDLLDESGDPARALDEALTLGEGIVARYPRIAPAPRILLADFVGTRAPALMRALPESAGMPRWERVRTALAEWRRSSEERNLASFASAVAVWKTLGRPREWQWVRVSTNDFYLAIAGPGETLLAVAVNAPALHETLSQELSRASGGPVRFELVSPFAGGDPARPVAPVLAERRLAAPFGVFSLVALPSDAAAFEGAVRLQTRLYMWGAGILAVAIVAGGTLLWLVSAAEIRRARRRTEFVAAVSHDLRTPLSSMRMLAESLYLGRILDAEKRQRFLGTIVNECDRLGRLTDRALYFIRYGQGALKYRLTEGDFGALVQETADAFVARGVEQGRRLRVQVAGGLPAVRFDAGAMEQVVLNLLDNADKYSPDRKEIAVTVDATGHRKCVVLAVQDRGIGIPAGDLRRIFDAYYRGARAKAGDATGVGLGLAVCRHIVRAHGGRIEVESVVGEGSTFRVVLPAA